MIEVLIRAEAHRHGHVCVCVSGLKGSDGSDPEEPEHTISLETVTIFTVTLTDVCTAVCAVHDGNMRVAQHVFSLLVSSFLGSHYM